MEFLGRKGLAEVGQEQRPALSPRQTDRPIEDIEDDLVSSFGGGEEKRLLTERLGCFLLHRADNDAEEDANELVAELCEWFQLASFLIGCPDLAGSTEGRRRKLYGDIRACVRKLEISGLYVLGGVMEAPEPDIPDWKIAVVAISSRRTDPGAGKRRHILVDRRCAAPPANWPRSAAARQ